MATTTTTTIKCPRCWKHVPASAAFCRRCGASLTSAQPGVAAAAAAPAPLPRTVPPPYRRTERRGSPRAAVVAVSLGMFLAGLTLRLGSPPPRLAPPAPPRPRHMTPALRYAPPPPPQVTFPGRDVNWRFAPAPPTIPPPPWRPDSTSPPWPNNSIGQPPVPPNGDMAVRRWHPNPYRRGSGGGGARADRTPDERNGRTDRFDAPGRRAAETEAPTRRDDD